MEKNIAPKIQLKLSEVGTRKQYEMGFWLDSYEDLFSDFDPRQYSQRQLSNDFLYELKLRYREIPKGKLEVRFYIPKKLRKLKLETSTKKKMKDYFSFELKQADNRRMSRQKGGLVYLAAGVLILTINGVFAWEYPQDRFLEFIGFILAPAGWFSTWTAFEKFFIEPEEERRRREFLSRMTKCEFLFFDLESAENEYAKQFSSEIQNTK